MKKRNCFFLFSDLSIDGKYEQIMKMEKTVCEQSASGRFRNFLGLENKRMKIILEEYYIVQAEQRMEKFPK